MSADRLQGIKIYFWAKVTWKLHMANLHLSLLMLRFNKIKYKLVIKIPILVTVKNEWYLHAEKTASCHIIADHFILYSPSLYDTVQN